MYIHGLHTKEKHVIALNPPEARDHVTCWKADALHGKNESW